MLADEVFRSIAREFIYETGAAGPAQFGLWLAHPDHQALADRFAAAVLAGGSRDALIAARLQAFAEAMAVELHHWRVAPN